VPKIMELRSMDNKEFSKELEKRTKKFAINVIQLSSSLPNTPEAKVVRNQITKCGTSVGANYREANRARSRADFKNKIKICEGDASETQYWIEIIMEVGWVPRERLRSDHEECTEILAIFTSISINTQKRDKKRKY
jgi:four helix bundle protein